MDVSTIDPVAAAVSAGAGLVVPLIQSVVNRPGLSSAVKQHIAMALSLVAAIIVVFATGSAGSIETWLVSIGIVRGVAQVFYELVAKPTGLAPAIERSTGPKAKPIDQNDPLVVEALAQAVEAQPGELPPLSR